jgi:hypothetical protein
MKAALGARTLRGRCYQFASGHRSPLAGSGRQPSLQSGGEVGHFLYVKPKKPCDYDDNNHHADDIENVHFSTPKGDTCRRSETRPAYK